MKLGIDLRILPADGSAGSGIPQAARELWEALISRAAEYSIELVGAAQSGAYVPCSEHVRTVSASGRDLKKLQKTEQLDGWIVPSGAVSPWLSGKIYPWVHDIAIFEHPEWFPQSHIKRLLTTQLFTRGLRMAAHIFSVSETTKRDLVRRLKIEPERVTVTGQGIAATSWKDLPWPAEVPVNASYILALGTIEPRKNLEFLLNVWDELISQIDSSVHLVIAGAEGWGKALLLDHKRVIPMTSFDNMERDRLIKHALVVAVPSLYEGFGRVALEAMVAGTPVIVSNQGALPEVVAEGGIVLSLNQTRWVQEARLLLMDPALRAHWSEQGIKRAKHWSWPQTAKTVLARIQADC